MAGFATPSNSYDSNDGDDAFAGMGIPDTLDLPGVPVGVFDAQCVGAKLINSANFQGMALEFELSDPDHAGEKYAIMARKIDPSDRANVKKAANEWLRIGQACAAMGMTVDARTQTPVEGFTACAGLRCRLAVSTYHKDGQDKPTIVWGRPKSRKNLSGEEVGFPEDLADDSGKFRDYGCGVLPAE